MTRINVYRDNDDSYGEGQILDGWFSLDSATGYDEATRWDGSNHISIPTGSQWNHEGLYRTGGGRWVLHSWSQWQGSNPSYRFVGDAAAREWLLANDHDDAVTQWWGAPEAERGPGRPEIGMPINIRLGDELLARVDKYAALHGRSRAETIRELVAAALPIPSLWDQAMMLMDAGIVADVNEARDEGGQLTLTRVDLSDGRYLIAGAESDEDGEIVGYSWTLYRSDGRDSTTDGGTDLASFSDDVRRLAAR